MKKLSLLFIPLLFLFSCSSDDNMDNQDTAIMEVEKDGVLFTVTTFNNTLVNDTQGEYAGRRLDLRGTVDGGTFIVTVSNWDWQNPPENGVVIKSYDTNIEDSGPNTICQGTDIITYCDGGLGTWFMGNTILVTELMDNDTPGIITITANDPTERTVSGSFDFLTSMLGSEETTHFKGTFENLSY